MGRFSFFLFFVCAFMSDFFSLLCKTVFPFFLFARCILFVSYLTTLLPFCILFLNACSQLHFRFGKDSSFRGKWIFGRSSFDMIIRNLGQSDKRESAVLSQARPCTAFFFLFACVCCFFFGVFFNTRIH